VDRQTGVPVMPLILSREHTITAKEASVTYSADHTTSYFATMNLELFQPFASTVVSLKSGFCLKFCDTIRSIYFIITMYFYLLL